MNRNNCTHCIHCYFKSREPGYSEYTPSSPLSWSCNQGFWEIDEYEETLESLTKKLETSVNCPEFVHRNTADQKQ